MAKPVWMQPEVYVLTVSGLLFAFASICLLTRWEGWAFWIAALAFFLAALVGAWILKDSKGATERHKLSAVAVVVVILLVLSAVVAAAALFRPRPRIEIASVPAGESAGTDTNESDKILDRLGGAVTQYRRWNPHRDQNVPEKIGTCVGEICPEVSLLGIAGSGRSAVAEFELLGAGDFIVRLPLRAGCWREVLTIGEERVVLAVEDDTYYQTALGSALTGRAPQDRPPSRAPDWTRSPRTLAHSGSSDRIMCPDSEYICSESLGIRDEIACLRDQRSGVVAHDTALFGTESAPVSAAGSIAGWLLTDDWKQLDGSFVDLSTIQRASFHFHLFRDKDHALKVEIRTPYVKEQLAFDITELTKAQGGPLHYGLTWNPECVRLYLFGSLATTEGRCIAKQPTPDNPDSQPLGDDA